MGKSIKDVVKFIKDNDIKMVDFKMVDINGQFRHVTIPAYSFSEETMEKGIGFDASNYGYAVVEKSDMVFIPDPDTAMVDPFCEVPTLTMSGNAMIIDSPANRPLAQYPRNIVLAAEQYMRDSGVADTMLILPEFEFYLFDQVGWEVQPNSISMCLDAQQSYWNSFDEKCISFTEQDVYTLSASPGNHSEIINRAIQSGRKYTAAICFSDLMALEFMTETQGRHIEVISFDDIRSKFIMPVRFTSITSSKTKVGNKAFQTLINTIENPSMPTQHIVLKTKIVER